MKMKKKKLTIYCELKEVLSIGIWQTETYLINITIPTLITTEYLKKYNDKKEQQLLKKGFFYKYIINNICFLCFKQRK